MNKLFAHAVLVAVVMASPAAMAADRTITLSVKNMDCVACPSIVKASLLAVLGVAKVEVSYKDRTATITYDDASECAGCGTKLKPKPGDCCVFCSYGSVPCPPIQAERSGESGAASCCAG